MKRSSVHSTVCLSHRSTADATCIGFAAERRAGRRYQSIAAAAGGQQQPATKHGAEQQMRAVSRSQLMHEVEHM